MVQLIIEKQRCMLEKFKAAYPEFIKQVSLDNITWYDGEVMPTEYEKLYNSHSNSSNNISSSSNGNNQAEMIENPVLAAQVVNVCYQPGEPFYSQFHNDPGRIRYMPFFKKMYGSTKDEVENNLVTVYWLPKFYGEEFPLLVNKNNAVHKKLECIITQLEILITQSPGKYERFLCLEDDNIKPPASTFNWRVIANTNRISPHGFGIAFDLETSAASYWQWDLEKQKIKISESQELKYQNHIPSEIVTIFENHGFIWGGKWYHYDTQHFEYRPELLLPSCADCCGNYKY